MAIAVPLGGFGGGTCSECFYRCRQYAAGNTSTLCMIQCTKEYPRCDFEPPLTDRGSRGGIVPVSKTISVGNAPRSSQLSGIKNPAGCHGSSQTWKGCFDCLSNVNGFPKDSGSIDAIRAECDKRYPFTRGGATGGVGGSSVSRSSAMVAPRNVGMSGINVTVGNMLIFGAVGALVGALYSRDTKGAVIGAAVGAGAGWAGQNINM